LRRETICGRFLLENLHFDGSLTELFKQLPGWLRDLSLFPKFLQYRNRNLILCVKNSRGKEEKLFGAAGCEKIVAQVAELERSVGIYEWAQFTPPK